MNLLSDLILGAPAYAQAAQGGAQQSPIASLLPIVLIFGIFYFLIIRPNKKRMDEEAKANAALAKGDEIYMKSGVLGTITGLTDKVVTIEVAEGVKLKFLRSQIGGKADKVFGSNADAKDAQVATSN